MQHSSMDARLLRGPEDVALCGDWRQRRLFDQQPAAGQVYDHGLARNPGDANPRSHDHRQRDRATQFRLQAVTSKSEEGMENTLFHSHSFEEPGIHIFYCTAIIIL